MAKKKIGSAPQRCMLTMDEYDAVTLEMCHVEALVELFRDRFFGDERENQIDQSLVTFLDERVIRIRRTLSGATRSEVSHG